MPVWTAGKCAAWPNQLFCWGIVRHFSTQDTLSQARRREYPLFNHEGSRLFAEARRFAFPHRDAARFRLRASFGDTLICGHAPPSLLKRNTYPITGGNGGQTFARASLIQYTRSTGDEVHDIYIYSSVHEYTLNVPRYGTRHHRNTLVKT